MSNLNSKPQATQIKTGGWLLTIGLLLAGIGGAFGAWVWRAPVALQLTAPGLAEFVKFLPDVRSTQVQVERLYFLLPLFVAMLALPMSAENGALGLPRWWRWLLRLAVVPLALAGLSPVWTPAILMSAEFRLQTILAGVAIGLTVIAPLLRQLPLRPAAGGLVVANVAAIALPYWQFVLVQPGLEEAYHESIAPGWGWWLTVAGLLLSLIAGLRVAFFSGQSNQS